MDCKYCKFPPEKILAETPTSYVVLGGQLHHGHMKIVFKRHVEELTELDEQEYLQFCKDMLRCAKVVEKVFKPAKMNYELLGNWWPHLHWHIYPRYEDDPDFAQPPFLEWKVGGERAYPPRVDMKPEPLTPDELKRLKVALEASFDQKR